MAQSLLVTAFQPICGGVYMRKLAPARVAYQDGFLISYLVYIMTESLHISLFEGAKRDLLVYYCYSLPFVRKYQVGEYAPPRDYIITVSCAALVLCKLRVDKIYV